MIDTPEYNLAKFLDQIIKTRRTKLFNYLQGPNTSIDVCVE